MPSNMNSYTDMYNHKVLNNKTIETVTDYYN